MQTLDDHQPLDAKEWALTIFISSLPVIGIIMLLIWAFSEGSNIHKKNWAKGTLILWIIGFIIAFAFLFLFGGIAIMSQMFNN